MLSKVAARAFLAATTTMPMDQLRALAKSNGLLEELMQLEEEADAKADEADELRLELKQLKLERKAVLEREKECKELANYLVSLRRMEDEQSGLVALAS